MRALVLMFCVMSLSALHAQSLDYYIPAGFNNPLLKSGQFITSLYYTESKSVHDYADGGTENSSKNWQFVGYLGLAEGLTLRADLGFYPEQTISEITSGGAGEDKQTFHLRPDIVLSYRPTSTLEIFGNFSYGMFTQQNGPRSLYQDVPVGVNPDGSYIYERRLVTQPGWDVDIKFTSIRMGISYYGTIW